MEYLCKKTARLDPLFELKIRFFEEKSIYTEKIPAKILKLRKKGFYL